MYFPALLPYRHSPALWLLWVPWTPVPCMPRCLGLHLDTGTALPMPPPWCSSGPGKHAAEARGHWLGVNTTPSPLPAASLDAATAFQRPAELDGMDLNCSVVTGLRANKYWHFRAPLCKHRQVLLHETPGFREAFHGTVRTGVCLMSTENPSWIFLLCSKVIHKQIHITAK